MDKDTFTFNNQTYSDNNNILLGIINELQQISNSSHENLTIKRISDIIIKMNFIVNENRKNMGLIMNQFTLLQNQMKQLSQKIDFNSFNTNTPKYSTQITNNINNQQELIGVNGGRYVGQVVNGLPEGKGIEYLNNGDRYEGDFRNGKHEGKGIYYHNNGGRYEGDFRNGKKEGKGIADYPNGDRYEGDFRNGKPEGKGIYYFNNGNRYEGDWKNGKMEGKGIYYKNNGDRAMGDFYNGKPIGKHVMLTRNGEVIVNNC